MVWQVDLSGKCIVVTGGNRGIGLAISHQCAQAGAHVAIIYRSSEDAPEVAKSIAEKYQVRCEAYKCDVADSKAMQELMKTIYHDVGPVGGVVCNAGVIQHKPALEITKDDFDTIFNANVWGAFATAQAAGLLWKEHGYEHGRIIFVSSTAATVTVRDSQTCLYPPSKGAINQLAKTLAMEWADMGILVNVISPGATDTDMNDRFRKDPELKKSAENDSFLKRIGTADEQAGMVVFYLSDFATYITGQQLIIDGGLTSW